MMIAVDARTMSRVLFAAPSRVLFAAPWPVGTIVGPSTGLAVTWRTTQHHPPWFAATGRQARKRATARLSYA
jgi:hypothetical protein